MLTNPPAEPYSLIVDADRIDSDLYHRDYASLLWDAIREYWSFLRDMEIDEDVSLVSLEKALENAN